MNSKGQTLVLFVALIPFIFILFVFSFDISKLYSEKTKLNNIAETSLKYTLMDNKNINTVRNNIQKNDKDIKITNMTSNTICLEKKESPVFGRFLGKNTFNIKSCFKGKVINNKLILEKKGK